MFCQLLSKFVKNERIIHKNDTAKLTVPVHDLLYIIFYVALCYVRLYKVFQAILP